MSSSSAVLGFFMMIGGTAAFEVLFCFCNAVNAIPHYNSRHKYIYTISYPAVWFSLLLVQPKGINAIFSNDVSVVLI